MTQTFSLLTARIELDSPELEAAVRAAWGQEVLPAQTRPRLSVEVADAVQTGPVSTAPVSTGQVSTVQTSQGPLKLILSGRGWVQAGGRVRVQLAQPGEQEGRAIISLPLDPSNDEALASHLALTEAGRAAGLLPLHAAVLARDGRAVGVTGQSGAGKSTAALRLLEAGWSLVAEDSAWLDPVSFRVAGADVGLRVFEASVRRFAPGWLEQRAALDAHGKLWFGTPRVQGATLERMYLLGAPPLGQLSPAAAVTSWWAASGLPISPLTRQTVSAHLGRVASRIPTESIDRDELVTRLTQK
ncbi:hypothetical protein [Deinococcus sp.]|uniref:hypothetical protein n=1 Tax=Deinococcus sp. TaxID=47478 RepID=UPI003CC644AD